MSDILVLETKLDTLATVIGTKMDILAENDKDLQGRFDEVDSRLDNHSELLRSLKQWRDSNGGPGAEERLRCAERFVTAIDKENIPPRLNMAEANIVTLQHVADREILKGVQGAVTDTLDARARTFVEKLKAWGPIIAALCAMAGSVLAVVLAG